MRRKTLMKAYLVGGAVRDQLLGLPLKDKDWVVVGTTAEWMLSQGYQRVGADFPVFLHPHTKEEYALARTERKSGKGYTGFECFFSPDVTLEEDLLRRDLTINAMAMDAQGTLVDPHQGKRDLDRKLLRHVSPAFEEDPLRVLRVARFYARFHPLGFSIAPETKKLMRKIVQTGELDHLTAERVWQETARALLEQSPRAYFEALLEVGALKIIMPELDALFGVPQPPQYHPEIDSGEHSLMVLTVAGQLSKDLSVRFAALVHDLGKALTPKSDWPHHIGHELAGLKPIKILCQRLKIPNECRNLALIAAEQHLKVHQATQLKASTLLKLFQQCDGWRRQDRFRQLLQVCEADARGRGGKENSDYEPARFLTHLLEQLNAANMKDLIASGAKGAELGEQIRLRRLSIIQSEKTKWLACPDTDALKTHTSS